MKNITFTIAFASIDPHEGRMGARKARRQPRQNWPFIWLKAVVVPSSSSADKCLLCVF